MHPVSAHRGAAICAALLLLGACQEHPKSNVPVEANTKRPEGTPVPSAELPEPPPADGFVIPERNKDGSLRVAGVIEYQANHLDKPVEITAYISFVSPECDPAVAKKKGVECPQPYMILQDDPSSTRQIMAVGYEEEFIKRGKLKEAETRIVKGTYQKMASGFAATENGLILLDAVDDIPVVKAKK
jgi:hypothetical protein